MLVVHLGTPKTGTKALQGFLATHSKRLREQGICYMEAGRYSPRRQRLSHSHSELAQSLLGRTDRTAWKNLRAELEKSSSQTNVISAEGFWFTEPGELRAEIPESEKVRLVVYLRRQDKYLQSLWKQAVVGGRRHSFKEWRHRLPTRGSYLTTVQRWVEHFGLDSVIIRPYEREGNVDTVEDFCSFIGVTDLEKEGNVGRNPSPRRELLHFIRALNQADVEVDRHKLFRAIIGKSDTYIRSCDMLSYAESIELMNEHAESNKILIENYYRGQPAPLFPEVREFEAPEIWDFESDEFFRLTADVIDVLVDFAAAGKLSSFPDRIAAQANGTRAIAPDNAQEENSAD